MPNFQILHRQSGCAARCGLLNTSHGEVETPVFMPVGTAGSVKGLTPAQLEATGVQMILANTYHLLLRPGVEVVEKLGGLHKFMAWQRPILTDSGGYQVFSLSRLTRIDDHGVEFASHIDGSRFYLDAEKAVEFQGRLGADVIMCLDQCTAFPVEADELKRAVNRTLAWAERSKREHRAAKLQSSQLLFGIVQGGIDVELRRYCADELVKMDFDGYAIGGLSVGEGHDNMIRVTAATAPLLPEEKPRYLMGVGMPLDIIRAVEQGIDMFDCVLPTRNGRSAFAFTADGPVRLRNNAHVASDKPVDDACDCYCCRHFTRGAIRHFFNCGEMLGPILLSVHNLRFYQRLMSEIRERIKADRFTQWAQDQVGRYADAPEQDRFSPDAQIEI